MVFHKKYSPKTWHVRGSRLALAFTNILTGETRAESGPLLGRFADVATLLFLPYIKSTGLAISPLLDCSGDALGVGSLVALPLIQLSADASELRLVKVLSSELELVASPS